ncbi:MAG: ribosome silencing factor [Eubacteriales bacterium]
MTAETENIINHMKEWISDKKGMDTEAIDVSGLTSLTDVFVITSGSSDKNVQAIADHVEEEAENLGVSLLHKEGRQNGRWILLDFNHIVVHVFHQEEREFYHLERLWSDGKRI